MEQINGLYISKFILLLVVSLLLVGSAALCSAESSSTVPEVPVKGMVTLLELGADRCVPCKMMVPIMAELEKEYEGKAAILFIDVWKHYEQVDRFSLRAIPTQIFYAKNGEEALRHEGFMDKESIVAVLQKLGVE
jgi:thioredoxin 1